jgi:hypothetical protein
MTDIGPLCMTVIGIIFAIGLFLYIQRDLKQEEIKSAWPVEKKTVTHNPEHQDSSYWQDTQDKGRVVLRKDDDDTDWRIKAKIK